MKFLNALNDEQIFNNLFIFFRALMLLNCNDFLNIIYDYSPAHTKTSFECTSKKQLCINNVEEQKPCRIARFKFCARIWYLKKSCQSCHLRKSCIHVCTYYIRMISLQHILQILTSCRTNISEKHDIFTFRDDTL